MEKFDDIEISPKKTYGMLAVILLVALTSVMVVFSTYMKHFDGDIIIDNEKWGQFGDFIGGTLNPILSFLGLIALLLTIVMQSKELKATTVQLERSANAQEKTEDVLKKQSETLTKQQFENTFFSLLEQHNKALENISALNEKRTDKNSHVVVVWRYVFSHNIIELDEAKAAMEDKGNLCGHYFRILYQVLKFIAINVPDSKIDSSFKESDIIDSPLLASEKMYSNIVRSFLNYNVTQLLAINCFCPDREFDTFWKYKLLVERYSFLEHMPFEINRVENVTLSKAKGFYDEKAFGNSDFIKSN
ncbi:putative phage abortive infection protein [Rheinheimera faecalis]